MTPSAIRQREYRLKLKAAGIPQSGGYQRMSPERRAEWTKEYWSRPEVRERHNARCKAAYSVPENKLKARAREAVRRALKRGTLVRGACDCGRTDGVQAHHRFYDRPLEVEWKCPSCHMLLHHHDPQPYAPVVISALPSPTAGGAS